MSDFRPSPVGVSRSVRAGALESGESVNLALSNPSDGLGLGTTPTAVLWIVSNE